MCLLSRSHQPPPRSLEEYGNAVQQWGFTTIDLCELARNSVMQSGFESKLKEQWLGPGNVPDGPLYGSHVPTDDVNFTNVPHTRLIYRFVTLHVSLGVHAPAQPRSLCSAISWLLRTVSQTNGATSTPCQKPTHAHGV